MNDYTLLQIDEILNRKILFDLPVSNSFIDTLACARELAKNQKLEQVATCHILSALIRDLGSPYSQALIDAGVNLYKIEIALKIFLDIPGKHNGKVTLSAGSRKLLKITCNEANIRYSPVVETKHLLLAFLKQVEGDNSSIARKILEEAKVDTDLVYTQISEHFK